MDNTFPIFGQTHVTVNIGGGKSFDAKLIDVKYDSEIKSINAMLKRASTDKDMNDLRQRLIKLAKTSVPEEHHDTLCRISMADLLRLVSYCYYGDEPDTDTAKKN